MTKVAGQNETVVKSVIKNWLMYAKFIHKLLLSIISRMKKGLINFGHNFCIPIIVCLSRSSFAVLILLLQWQMCQAMSDINNNKNRCCLMPGKRNKEGRIKKKCGNYLPIYWVEFRLYTVFPQKDPSLNNNQILIIPQNSCSTYIKNQRNKRK